MIDIAEEWRVCASAPDYEVSNIGRIRRRIDGPTGSKAGAIKAQQKMKIGYMQVTVQVDKKQKVLAVHRLVCAAFNGPQPSPLHEVAHNDGVRWHNNASNLRWATKKENHEDRIAHGTIHFGEQHYFSKINKHQALEILRDKRPQPQIAKQYGISQQTVSKIKTGSTWNKALADA